MATAATVDPETEHAHRRQARRGVDRARRFDNVNPATEEVIGQVADGSAADMHRAIAAARRAFDETDWSTNREFRKRCLDQLQDALEAEKEELREQLILEVGCPRMLTAGPQLDAPLADVPPLPDPAHRRVRVGAPPPRRRPTSGAAPTPGCIVKEPVGVVGAITPWNFPFEVITGQAGPGPRHRQHRGAQAGPGHAVERHPDRPPGRRAHRHPRRRAQRRHLLGPPGRRGADPLARGRPHLLHRVHRGGQADHGEGRGHHEAALPRAGRQVGHHRARRRRLRTRPCSSASPCARTPARAAPSRPGCCSPGRATTRASSG